MLIVLLALAAANPAQPAAPANLNPRAFDLFERDPVLNAWAIRTFDLNRDGWLTLYEAEPAVSAFREMADTDGDGRVTVGEFEAARAFVEARYGSADLASAP